QRLGEVEPAALAAGEDADGLLLVAAGEVEPAEVGAAVDLAAAEADHVEPVGDLLPDGLLGVERPVLVDVSELDGLADAEAPGVGLDLARDHAEERRLARAVGPDHADDAAGWEAEGEVLEEHLLAVGLRDALGLDDDVAEAGAGRDVDLELL